MTALDIISTLLAREKRIRCLIKALLLKNYHVSYVDCERGLTVDDFKQ